MSTTTKSVSPAELRKRRLRAGLTQSTLAYMAGCSLGWIANAEQGYLPEKSAVLERVLTVLDNAKNERPATTPDARETRPGGGRHESE